MGCLSKAGFDWLGREFEGDRVLRVKYLLEAPWEKHDDENLFIAVYKTNHSGALFHIKLERKAGERYDIVNNAYFQLNGHEWDFPGEPLGGVWTHEKLTSVLARFSKRTATSIRRSEIDIGRAECQSYLDQYRHPPK